MDRQEVPPRIREFSLPSETPNLLQAHHTQQPPIPATAFPLQADESQDVLHLNYTSWPDHGVPTVNAIESILQFVLIVRQQANRTKEPLVVHCRLGSDQRHCCDCFHCALKLK